MATLVPKDQNFFQKRRRVEIAKEVLVELIHSTIIYKTLSIECNPNPKILTNVSCRLKPINWQKSVCIWDSDILQPLKNVSVNFQLLKMNGANKYLPFLINTTLNVCDLIGKRSSSAYGRIIKSILKEMSNVDHSCPYTGHLSLYNLYVDERFIPFDPPIGRYKVILRFREGYPYVDIGTTVLYLEAMEKRERRGKVTAN
ncbi:uncharacterized protein LOC115066695 [Bactrocera dorsalis]|uniref:Uncharacterized protein LOC115066695 n=1 Tax=Bactrocera dorsalis TaxID=27457 RepID=A0ABM3JR73_BACDO|nr:uncharacterized protein LOC115066695 [Bactrocera dorsalis]